MMRIRSFSKRKNSSFLSYYTKCAFIVFFVCFVSFVFCSRANAQITYTEGLSTFSASSGNTIVVSGGDAAGADSSSSSSGSMIVDAINIAMDLIVAAGRAVYQYAVTALMWLNSVLINATTAELPFLFEKVKASLSLGALAEIVGTSLNSKMKVSRAKATNDTRVKLAVAKAIARDAMAHVVPNNNLLCQNIKLGQVYGLTESYMRDTSEKVQRSLAYVGRGAKDDYSGPLYAVDIEKWRCKWGFGDPAMGYTEIAGVSCANHENLDFGSAKRRLINADLAASTLDGMMPLERPPMKVDTIDGVKSLVLDVDETNPNQLMWLAADNFCRQMQGPRITPLHGKNIDTPTGLPQRAVFENTLSRQTQFNKACTDLLAYHTRPNMDEQAELIEAQNVTCEMARGSISDSELSANFDNCEKGLSQYQAEYIQHKKCKTLTNTTTKRASGRVEHELSDDMLDCSINWTSWQLSVAARQGDLIDAVIGQQRIKSGGR